MKVIVGLVASISIVLAGCGGGESGGVGGTPTSVSVSGIAIDGNLYKATVFLDLNGDGLLTPGEPTSTTNEAGSFTLSATQDQLEKNKVVVLAVVGTTIDQDNPNTTIASSFTLLAPAGNPSVVSPLTTQVVAKMDAGATLENAKSAVQAELGLASIDVMKNYVALKATDPDYAKAHNIAAAVAEVLKTIEADTSSVTKLSDKLATLRSKVTTQVAPNVEAIKSATSLSLAVQIANIPKTPKSVTITSVIRSLQDGASTALSAVMVYTDNTTQIITALVDWVITKVSGVDADGIITKTSDGANLKAANSGFLDLVASYLGKVSDALRIQITCDTGSPSSNPFSTCAPGAKQDGSSYGASDKLDKAFSTASIAMTSFVNGELPICGASKDYPIKIFFEAYDPLMGKGKVFIYGGTNCKSGIEGVYSSPAKELSVIEIQMPNLALSIGKIDAKSLRVEVYSVNSSGAKSNIFSGITQVSLSYDTNLYAGAYWSGIVCRYKISTANTIDSPPNLLVVRTGGYPTYDLIESSGCPQSPGWDSFNVSRHRAVNLLSEQESSPVGRLKNYHFQLTHANPINWDYQYIGPNQNDASPYPTKCDSGVNYEYAYMSHLTQSKDGFTAAGYVCYGGKVYYQYVKGVFDLNGYSFVTSVFPWCNPNSDYPAKVFFDQYDNASKLGKVFIYGGRECQSGIEARYAKLYIPGYSVTIGTSNRAIDLKNIVKSNNIGYDSFSRDSSGTRTLLESGSFNAAESYSTSLYAGAYWNGTVCKIKLTDLGYSNQNQPTDPPNLQLIRGAGMPDINSNGCPPDWEMFNVSRHRASNLLSEEDFLPITGANKLYHYPLPESDPTNWDYQLISSSPSQTVEYPKACPNLIPAFYSYWAHLTQSLTGFTASGLICDGGDVYYQFVNGQFVK